MVGKLGWKACIIMKDQWVQSPCRKSQFTLKKTHSVRTAVVAFGWKVTDHPHPPTIRLRLLNQLVWPGTSRKSAIICMKRSSVHFDLATSAIFPPPSSPIRSHRLLSLHPLRASSVHPPTRPNLHRVGRFLAFPRRRHPQLTV